MRFALIAYNGAPVSSTEIRVLAGACMPLDGLVPKSVETFIFEKGTYEIAGARLALSLEKPERAAHSIRVAKLAVEKAKRMGISERQVLTATLLHDCAKNLSEDSPYLQGFSLKAEWGDVPPPVLHQYQGAYVAEKFLGVTQEDELNAIRFHTSARPNMSALEKLVFLADMLEEKRQYEGVDELRTLFWEDGLDKCLTEALRQTLLFLESKGGAVYPLTRAAYEFYKK